MTFAGRAVSRHWWLIAVAGAVVLAVLPVFWRVASAPPADTTIAGLDLLTPPDRARIDVLLHGGAVSLPEAVQDFREPADVAVQATSPLTDRFDVVSPVGTAVVSDRPTFAWRPLAGATLYIVSILDDRAELVQRSEWTEGTQWTASKPLPRNATYLWQVTATRGGTMFTTPAAPAQPARFRVVAEDTAAALTRLETERPDAHLLAGLANFEAGVVDMARRHLQLVPDSDPHAAVAHRALQVLSVPMNPARR